MDQSTQLIDLQGGSNFTPNNSISNNSNYLADYLTNNSPPIPQNNLRYTSPQTQPTQPAHPAHPAHSAHPAHPAHPAQPTNMIYTPIRPIPPIPANIFNTPNNLEHSSPQGSLLQTPTRDNVARRLNFFEEPTTNLHTPINFPNISPQLNPSEQTLTPHLPPNLDNVVCEQSYYAYVKSQLNKKHIARAEHSLMSLTPVEDKTKLIQQLDGLFFESENFSQKKFTRGEFQIVNSHALDYGGPFHEYLRLLGENLSQVFVEEYNGANGQTTLKLSPELKDLSVFNAPIITLLNVIRLLGTKNVNVISQFKLGHIVKLLIIDRLEVNIPNPEDKKSSTVDLNSVPAYFLTVIINYIKYCSRQERQMSDEEIRGFLGNLYCFKAVVYNFVAFVHSRFAQELKIDLDYIQCFGDGMDFTFADDIDWDVFLVEPEVKKLIEMLKSKLINPNVFQLYSAFYYNETVQVEDFINVLKFNQVENLNGTRPFPVSLKDMIIAICRNYQSQLDPANEETQGLIESAGTQEEFVKKLLIYMSSLEVLVPGAEYTFNLTFGQQDVLFSHTCSRTIDILEIANSFTPHELARVIILTISGPSSGFNRAG